MEVYTTEDHYILHEGEFSLWCDRSSGTLEAKRGFDICSAWNPICIGLVHGVIGKVKIHPDSDWRLLLIRQKTLVGKISNEHNIYRIDKIVILPLSNTEPVELDLELCKKHHFGIKKTQRITQQANDQTKALQKTWKTIKTAAENVKPKRKDVKDRDKYVRRIIEEVQKMYNDSDFFYYSDTYDLTTSVQRQHSKAYNRSLPLWKRVDQKFFWNRHLIDELCNSEAGTEDEELSCHWIIPIIQGYFQIETCVLEFPENKSPAEAMMLSDFGNTKNKDPLTYNLGIISRRSVHRAGTRSKKRGLDETGACANYVETEQIFEFSCHTVSFVQVRGSIPVYWSQSGIKYRPPPKLDRDESENKDAFKKHFDEELCTFKSIVTVNLAELLGKEKALSDTYLYHTLQYNSPNITYVTFDFHEYCRGMKFENVSVLTDGINDIIKKMRYCWVDQKGMICEQRGVFRVNCVDCLDRTNVVQTAVARIVMETQCRKLGMLAPDETLPQNCKTTFQQLWANNGDMISRQYAGTAALKGDFTRTGERKFSGMMKDGMNSANRYYLRFKDSYRQAAIDLTLGRPVVLEESMLLGNSNLEEDSAELMEKEQNLKLLVEDCKEMLIVEPEQCLGGWSLINADPVTGDPDRTDMDIILLLSQRAVYVAWYDDEEEGLYQYQRIFLEDIESIEIGPEPAMFKSKFICLRLHYQHYAEEGFFHTFRTPNTRLFNNMVIAVHNQEEAKESLKAIHQAFSAARQIMKMELEILDKPKLERKKTRDHPEVHDIHKQQQEVALTGIHIPRDISSPDLQRYKSGGLSPEPQRTGSRPVSPIKRSPNTSPRPVKRNLLSNLSADMKKTLNAGIKLNFTVPKFSLQNVSLPKSLGGKSKTSKTLEEEQDRIVLHDKRVFLRERKISQDDSTVGTVSGSFDESMVDEDDAIVLDSCGILATKSMTGVSDSSQLLTDEQNPEQISKLCHEKDFKKETPTNTEDGTKDTGNAEGAQEEDESFIVIEDTDVDKLLQPPEVNKSAKLRENLNIKVPKIVTPAAKTRKLQRIRENLEADIEKAVGDRECFTQIVIV